VPPVSADDAFAEAEAWLTGIRSGSV
jgi:hypothetical protein